MANTIDWGKASVNNTNGYGKGAIDNAIRWGKIYESSASGETNIGTATTPSFTNTKSVRFDGVDDFVTMGNVLATSNTGADAFSISCWYKTSQQGTQMIVARMLNLGPFSGYALNMVSNNMLSFFLGTFNGNAYINVRSNSVTTHSDGNWHHLAVTYDGSRAASGVTMYFDNSVLATNTIHDVAPNNINAQSPDFMIGARGNSSSIGFEFNGGIDEVAVFNSELSASDISAIYGSGVPSDLSTYSSLVSWWRMGDSDSFPTLSDNKGSNDGTMTNMTSGNIITDVPT